MYLQNKYTTWYNNIISNAQARQLPQTCYKEKHHIIPRSLGGTNEMSNLANLTAKEHFICHLLLTKMTTGANQQKMVYALWRMGMLFETRNHHVIKSHTYTRMREQFSQLQSDRYTGKGNPNFGKTHSEETRNKIKAARALQDTSYLKNRVISPEWREKLRIASINNPNKHDPKPKDQCIKCGGLFARHIIKRWHGLNCRTINN